MLTLPTLFALGAIYLILVIFAPFYTLVFFDLCLIRIVEPWYLGGTLVDPSDLFVASFGLAILLRARFSPRTLLTQIPYLIPWLMLGTVLSLSYVASPENAENLTSPVRVAYQVYRYCWKGLLYYPICLIVLRSLKHARITFAACVLGANLCAAQAVYQGYTGVSEPPGPFVTGNGLAAVLAVPFILSLSGILFPASRLHWLFSGASFVLMMRAILFSASRGGMVSVTAAAGVLGAIAFLIPSGRKRIFRVLPIAILASILLLLARPDLLERPTVKHAMTVSEGSKTANMQWRIQERWPHFIDIALDNPWLGTGTYIDKSLSQKANTPHNGYIAVAVKYGLIAFGLFLFFLLRLLRDCFLAFRRSSRFDERMFFLTLASAMVGLMTHNLVETTWLDPVVLRYFWLICALVAGYVHVWDPSSLKVDHASSSSTPTRPAGWAPVGHPS